MIELLYIELTIGIYMEIRSKRTLSK